jgi:hypothetical protein
MVVILAIFLLSATDTGHISVRKYMSYRIVGKENHSTSEWLLQLLNNQWHKHLLLDRNKLWSPPHPQLIRISNWRPCVLSCAYVMLILVYFLVLQMMYAYAYACAYAYVQWEPAFRYFAKEEINKNSGKNFIIVTFKRCFF